MSTFVNPWWSPNPPQIVTPSVLADNFETTPVTIDGAPGRSQFRSNMLARVPLSIAAGTYSFIVYLASNFIGETGGGDPGVAVYVDGVYYTNLVPTANGVTPFPVSLDGAAHAVDLYNGYQQNTTTGVNGTYVTAVGGKGVSFRQVIPRSDRALAFYDNSQSSMLSSPAGQLSFVARTRAVFPGRVALEAWGGRRLADDAGASGRTGLGSINNLAARLVAMVAGASQRQIFMLIGVNDWGNGPWNNATFATNYSALLDQIHALDAGVTVYSSTFLISSNEAGAGFDGATKPTWRTAVAATASGRSWVVPVVGTNLMAAGGLAGDGLHPTTVGHQGIFDGTGGQGGSTNLRSILGF